MSQNILFLLSTSLFEYTYKMHNDNCGIIWNVFEHGDVFDSNVIHPPSIKICHLFKTAVNEKLIKISFHRMNK